MDKTNPIWRDLQLFANKHKLILEDNGEIGFGRPCVGFLHGQSYVAFNPMKFDIDDDDYYIWPEDQRLIPPDTARDAYHKHDCFAILVRGDNYDEALEQLHSWIKHLETLGALELVRYETGATGIQALISGLFSFAFRLAPT